MKTKILQKVSIISQLFWYIIQEIDKNNKTQLNMHLI